MVSSRAVIVAVVVLVVAPEAGQLAPHRAPLPTRPTLLVTPRPILSAHPAPSSARATLLTPHPSACHATPSHHATPSMAQVNPLLFASLYAENRYDVAP